ncbi:MAG: helix-turn-helix domain-containing protein [Pseudonocardiaceae bacterium]
MTPADPSPGPAARRRLAEQLRALRVAAGLSTTQLAHQLGWSQAKVSRIETAAHGVAPGDVRDWADMLKAPAEQAEHLVELGLDGEHRGAQLAPRAGRRTRR